MRGNTSFGIGNVAVIDKVNSKFGFFDQLFSGIASKAKNLKESAKLFTYNLTSPVEVVLYRSHCISLLVNKNETKCDLQYR